MNNKEFIQRLSKKTKSTADNTQKLVDSLFEEMGNAFEEGENIQFNNLGTFEVKKRLERIMTNPQTKQRMLVPPKLVLTFRQAPSVKEKLKMKGGKNNG